MLEVGIRKVMDQCRSRIVVSAGKGRAGGSDITDEAADVLRMVKQIEYARGKLNPELFGYVEVLRQRNVDIINGRQHAGVAAAVWKGPHGRRDVTRVRIIRKVGNCLSSAIHQGRSSRTNSGNPIPVDECAVAGRIAVQIRVNSTLHIINCTGLILIYRCYFPISDHVLHEPVLVLEGLEFVNGFDAKALPVIERGTGAIGRQILRVLRPSRSHISGEDFGSRIVDVVAPGIGSDELPPMGEAPGQSIRPAIVKGVTPRLVGRDDPGESRGKVSGTMLPPADFSA